MKENNPWAVCRGHITIIWALGTDVLLTLKYTLDLSDPGFPFSDGHAGVATSRMWNERFLSHR